MKRVKILGDIIDELVGKGYKLSFESFGKAKVDLVNDSVQRLSATAFEIDEVYCCYEYSDADDVVYVFAISSAIYGKSIVINAITEETTIAFGEILGKIKSAMVGLFSK